MYKQLSSKQSILCVLGIGFTIAICYAIHDEYFKQNKKSDD